MEDNELYKLQNPNAMMLGEKILQDGWIPPKKDEVQYKTNETIIQQQSIITTPIATPTTETNKYEENVPIVNIQNSSVIIPTETSTSNTVNESIDNSQQDITEDITENITQTDPLETDNKKDDKTQEVTKKGDIEEKEDKIPLYIQLGDRLIKELNLIYINDNLYFYCSENKYGVVTDKYLRHWIIKHMYKKATKALCDAIIYYIRNYMYSDETVVVDKNFVNFRNGLLDLKSGKLIEHTPNIFTINQIHANFIKDFHQNNETVNRYLDEITNYNVFRKKALLQIIGYCMTARNDIQQFVVFYGPTASNGKSTLVKIIIKIIGDENTTHKDIKAFEKQFRVNGIQGKLLNIVGETQQNKVNDTSVLKSTISGDIFETDVKYSDGTNINSYIKHIFTANTLPAVADKTDGFYRKLNLLMFDNRFDVSTSTFDVDEFSTQDNLDYIATWGILEFLEMVKSNCKKFANSDESDALKEIYRIENDTTFAFLTDVEISKTIYNTEISRQGMYNLYTGYCSRNELTPIGKKAFYRELRDKYHFAEKPVKGATEIAFYRELPVSNTNKLEKNQMLKQQTNIMPSVENNNIKMEGDLNNERYN